MGTQLWDRRLLTLLNLERSFNELQATVVLPIRSFGRPTDRPTDCGNMAYWRQQDPSFRDPASTTVTPLDVVISPRQRCTSQCRHLAAWQRCRRTIVGCSLEWFNGGAAAAADAATVSGYAGKICDRWRALEKWYHLHGDCVCKQTNNFISQAAIRMKHPVHAWPWCNALARSLARCKSSILLQTSKTLGVWYVTEII